MLVDGQIIYRNGRRYLQQSAPNASAESLTTLVTVLFHLVVLGVLALVSTVDVPADTPVEGVVMRLGIVLLIIGIAHCWPWSRSAGSATARSSTSSPTSGTLAGSRTSGERGVRAQQVKPEHDGKPGLHGESATADVNRRTPYPRA